MECNVTNAPGKWRAPGERGTRGNHRRNFYKQWNFVHNGHAETGNARARGHLLSSVTADKGIIIGCGDETCGG